MNYKIKGNICRFLREECTEPIFPAEVLLYLPSQIDDDICANVSNPKETFKVVSGEEKEARKVLLLTSVNTDEKGDFEFSVDEKYASTAFDIDFTWDDVKGTAPNGEHNKPVQFHLTTFYPPWRTENESDNYYYNWKYCITSKWWCYIRGYYFDAWVICGDVRNCETGSPIANAAVTAHDTNFLIDPTLGSAITDASGHFRIDNNAVQFKKAILSPWINIETDVDLELNSESDPDVYFKASIGGCNIDRYKLTHASQS